MEGFPNDTNPDPEEVVPETPESRAESFDDILAEAKKLKVQGADIFVEDYTESDNPAVIALMDRFDNWQAAYNLGSMEIHSPEKAVATVQSRMFWVELSENDPERIGEAIQSLIHERENTDNDEARQIIQNAITNLENSLVKKKPERKTLKLVEKSVAEAQEKINSGVLIDAVQILTSTLLAVRFQDFFKDNSDLKASITKLRDETREKWKAERFGNK